MDLVRVALDSPTGWIRVAAARTLARLGAAGAEELGPRLIPDAGITSFWYAAAAEPALELVAELHATSAALRPAGWLDTDQRIRSGQDDTVHIDERFQRRAVEVLADLATPGR